MFALSKTAHRRVLGLTGVKTQPALKQTCFVCAASVVQTVAPSRFDRILHGETFVRLPLPRLTY